MVALELSARLRSSALSLSLSLTLSTANLAITDPSFFLQSLLNLWQLVKSLQLDSLSRSHHLNGPSHKIEV